MSRQTKAPRHYLYDSDDAWIIRTTIPDDEVCVECGEWATIDHGGDEEEGPGHWISYYHCTTPGCWADYEKEWIEKPGDERE